MNLLLAGLVVVGFAVLLEHTHVLVAAQEVAARAAATVRIIRDQGLSDGEKERALRRDALGLFGLSAKIVGLSLMALLLPLGGVWLLDRTGLASMTEVLAILQRLDFLLVASVVAMGVYYVSRAATRG